MNRERLAALADLVAPAAHGMPAASEIDLCREGGPVDRVLALHPDLLAPLAEALEAAADGAALSRLEAERPAAYAALLETVAGAYYLDGTVRRRLGYRGQEALSLDKGRIGAEDALERMMARPPFWRPVPEDGEAP